MFGAKGDGVTCDTDAFIQALNSGKKIVCKKNNNYYFTKPIDVRHLQKGHIDGNGSVFHNFHIHINYTCKKNENGSWSEIPKESEDRRAKNFLNNNNIRWNWKVEYPGERFIIENIIFGRPTNAWNELPEGWQYPLITTGVPMILRNIIVKSYPYVLATTNSYMDYMLWESVGFSSNDALFKNETLKLDAVSVLTYEGIYRKTTNEKVNNEQVILNPLIYTENEDLEEFFNKYSNEKIDSASGVAGDSWRFYACNEFRLSGNDSLKDYCLIRPYNKRPVLFESCIQSQIEVAEYSKIIALGCHWENVSLKDSISSGKTNVLFINCYFYPNHVLLDHQNNTYLNCHFAERYLSDDSTLSKITGNKSWYDLKCKLINCSFGQHGIVNSNEFQTYKRLPKNTYTGDKDQINIKNFTTMLTPENPTDTRLMSSWLGGGFKNKGDYEYDIYLFSTSKENIVLKHELAQNVKIIKHDNEPGNYNICYADIENIGGGYCITLYRTMKNSDLDNQLYEAKYYMDPNLPHNTKIRIEDHGAFCLFKIETDKTKNVADSKTRIYIPWIIVNKKIDVIIKNNLYELNGSLVSINSSASPIYTSDVLSDNLGVEFCNKKDFNNIFFWKSDVKNNTYNLNDEIYEPGSLTIDDTDMLKSGQETPEDSWQDKEIYRSANFIKVEGGRTIQIIMGSPEPLIRQEGTTPWDRYASFGIFEYDENQNCISTPKKEDGVKRFVYAKYKDGESSTNFDQLLEHTLKENTAFIKVIHEHYDLHSDQLQDLVFKSAIVYTDNIDEFEAEERKFYIPKNLEYKTEYVDLKNTIIQSPNGSIFKLQVDDNGFLTTQEIFE